jgi:putative tryptophan/tyrosine transport system substrate-binding protein
VRRREFIAGLGGAAAWPVVARGQQPTVPRVGYVWIGALGTDPGYPGLRRGLEDRGYAVGRNLVLEERYADGHTERLPALMAELLALNVDVLATPGTQITRAAQRATSTVPIVCVTGDPVGTGLVTSLAHPGGNITGLSLLSGDYSAKWLELLKEAVPSLRVVAVLWNPDNPGLAGQLEHMREAASPLGLELRGFSVRPADVEASFVAIGTASLDGLVLTDDPFVATVIPRVIGVAAQRRMPALYAFSDSVQQGGLMSYSSNFFALWRRAAGYVDRILKGARPADLPVEQATGVALKINLKTASALGLEISPQLIARADEVIE